MSVANKMRVALVGSHQLQLSALAMLLTQADDAFQIVAIRKFEDSIFDELQEIFLGVDILILQGLDRQVSFFEELQTMDHMKVMIVSDTEDPSLMDQWVLCGIHGILGPDVSVEQFYKAIIKVFEGELWLDRFTTSRIVSEISGKKRYQDSSNYQLTQTLTDREKGVLRAILDGEGQALRDIAEVLFISEYTLRNHLTAMYSKLGVKNRLDLYVFARDHLGESSPK